MAVNFMNRATMPGSFYPQLITEANISGTTGTPATTTYTSGGVNYKSYAFTGSGSITLTRAGFLDCFLVGGGADGLQGSTPNGGGGASCLTAQVFLEVGTHTITVGGGSGGLTSIGIATNTYKFLAVGSNNEKGASGFSSFFGFNAGSANTNARGGAGGAGGVGGNAPSAGNGGVGGIGIFNTYRTGSNVGYGGGGGGGGLDYGGVGATTYGGGDANTGGRSANASNGSANTGGGGGGAWDGLNGTGGSGIVVVRVTT